MSKIATAINNSMDYKLGVLETPRDNGKTSKRGLCAATYATQYSCDPLCVFNEATGQGEGCYSNGGPASWTMKRLNNAASAIVDLTSEQIAADEATEIRKLNGLQPLRLHVSGDCDTDESARMVSAAAADYTAIAGFESWTYTHSWSRVDRESWGSVNVHASCETSQNVTDANAKGYATAKEVEHFESDKLYEDAYGDLILPCAQQTGRAANCYECGWCFNPKSVARRIARRISIGFAVHGAGGQGAKALAALRSVLSIEMVVAA